MKRLMLLIAAGSLWLFLAAVPVLADGGPHVAAINNGTSGINADSCAGCHRAHRAQGEFLLLADSGTALCLSCHGATGLGSKVDVESGIQYQVGTTTVRGTLLLGYLRGGGFVNARIGSGEAVRIGYTSTHGVGQLAKVPVRTAGLAARHFRPPAQRGRRGRSGGRRRLGQRPQQHSPHTPDPQSSSSAERATTRTATASIGSSIRSRSLRQRARTCSFRTPPASTSPTRRCRPPATPATTPSSRPNGGTGTLLASQVAALALPAHGRRLLPPEGSVERADRRVE